MTKIVDFLRSSWGWLHGFLGDDEINKRVSAALNWQAVFALVFLILITSFSANYFPSSEEGSTDQTAKNLPVSSQIDTSHKLPSRQGHQETVEVTIDVAANSNALEPQAQEHTNSSDTTTGPTKASLVKSELKKGANVVPPQDCDFLAANPKDSMRHSMVERGVALSELPWASAIPACEAAVRSYPNESRFAYQLERARQAQMEQKNKWVAVTEVYRGFERTLASGHGHALVNMKSLLSKIPSNEFCPTEQVCINRFVASAKESASDKLANWMTLARFYVDTDSRKLPCKLRQNCVDDAFKMAGKALSLVDGDAEAYQGYLVVEKGASKNLCGQIGCEKFALSRFKSARDQGEAWGARWLAIYYKTDITKDLCGGKAACDQKAKEAYLQAAQMGDAWAHNHLGDFALSQSDFVGCGTERACLQYAISRFKESFELGNYDRTVKLVQLLRDRDAGVLKCAERSLCDVQVIDILRKLEARKPYVAASHLGYMTDIGRSGIECSSASCDLEAKPFYEKAASKNIAWSIANLGNLYHGKSRFAGECESNETCNQIALKHYRSAEKLGNAWASLMIGDLTKSNPELFDCKIHSECLIKVENSYRLSVKNGDKNAITSLLVLLRDSEPNELGCKSRKRCDEEVMELINMLKKTSPYAAAAHQGYITDIGRSGVECASPNCDLEAIAFYQTAENGSVDWGIANLGSKYFDKTKVNEDCTTKLGCNKIAFAKFKRASELGNAWSFGKLGQMYEFASEATDCSSIRPQCINMAYAALKQAVSKGSVEGQVRLTQMTLFRDIGSNCVPLDTCKRKAIADLEKTTDSVGGWRESVLGGVAFNEKSKKFCRSPDCIGKAVEHLKVASQSGYSDATMKLIELAIEQPRMVGCTKAPCNSKIKNLYTRLVSQEWYYAAHDFSPLDKYNEKWPNSRLFSEVEEFELLSIAVRASNTQEARATRVERVALDPNEAYCKTVAKSCADLLNEDLKHLSASSSASALHTLSVNSGSCRAKLCRTTAQTLLGMAKKSDDASVTTTLISAYLDSGLLCSVTNERCEKEAIKLAQKNVIRGNAESYFRMGTALAPIFNSREKTELQRPHVKQGILHLKQARILGNDVASYHLILWSIVKVEEYSTARMVEDIHELSRFYDLPIDGKNYDLSVNVRKKLAELFLLNASTESGQKVATKLLAANMLNGCSFVLICEDTQMKVEPWVGEKYTKRLQKLIGADADGGWGKSSQEKYMKWVQNNCDDADSPFACSRSLMKFALAEVSNKSPAKLTAYFDQ